ncbi:hypothetical protein MKEN_00489400 [Mycena kentingensis (nom. inval.)]|nr:hypothetical protein MKEN_00489400 [Mycena kentingensis (nom. inval.)]
MSASASTSSTYASAPTTQIPLDAAALAEDSFAALQARLDAIIANPSALPPLELSPDLESIYASIPSSPEADAQLMREIEEIARAQGRAAAEANSEWGLWASGEYPRTPLTLTESELRPLEELERLTAEFFREAGVEIEFFGGENASAAAMEVDVPPKDA